MEQKSIVETAEYRDGRCDLVPHFHNGYEMILVLDGAMEITVNRKVRYTCGRGSLALISHHEEHDIRPLSQPYMRCYAILNTRETDRRIDAGLLSVLKNRPAGFAHCVDVSGRLETVERLFRQLIAEWEGNLPLGGELIACYVTEILIAALRVQRQENLGQGRAIPQQVHEVQRYLDLHFTQAIQIEALAARFYINGCYLSHCFRVLTGYSPKQYLTLLRMSLAKELLVTTALPVAEVTARCGFGDTNNFIRAFKRAYSATPGEYRRARASPGAC